MPSSSLSDIGQEGRRRDVQRGNVYQRIRRACHVEGMSIREAATQFGIHRKTVKKILSFSIPPGYQRSKPIKYPKLENFKGVIDAILADDRQRPKKQHHTAKRILERLREEYGFCGGYTIEPLAKLFFMRLTMCNE
jgi:hypothetical protein